MVNGYPVFENAGRGMITAHGICQDMAVDRVHLPNTGSAVEMQSMEGCDCDHCRYETRDHEANQFHLAF